MKKLSGFTLIELMITVAVVAILASIAMPSFTRLIQDQGITSQANDLLGSLMLARDEARKRGKNVVFAPVGASYAGGWTITTTNNDGTTYTLREHEAVDKIASTSISATITYNSLGQASSTVAAPFVFNLTPPSCAAGEKRQRTLSVAGTGRGSISVTACP